MKIMNKNPIFNKIFVGLQVKKFEVYDKNINIKEITDFLERDYDSIDDFFGELYRSPIFSREQKDDIVITIVVVYQKDPNMQYEIEKSPNADKFFKAILVGKLAIEVTNAVNKYLHGNKN